MNTLLNIILNPVKTFNKLKTEEKFPVLALIVLLTLVLIHLILTIPVSAKLSDIVISGMSSIPEKQKDMAIQMTHKLRYLSMIGGFVMYLIILFIQALVLFVIALLFKAQLSYTKVLRLIIYCFIVLIIGDIVNTAIVYFKGIDTIENMYSVMLTGANLLTSVEKAGVALYVFLSYINPFQLWFVVLLTIGIKIFTDFSWGKSFAICIIFWLIITLFPVASTTISQIAMARQGLM